MYAHDVLNHMIVMETGHIAQEKWHGIVSQFDDVNLMQLWEYAEVKRRLQGWSVVRHLFMDGNTVVGAAQAVVKEVPILKKGIVWINRAPLWQKLGNDQTTLQEMLARLHTYWVLERKMYLRIAPPIPDTADAYALMRERGYSAIPHTQWISGRVDLSKTEIDLRGMLKKKWRNCLQKAERVGVTSTQGTSGECFLKFLEDHEALLQKKGFDTPVTPVFVKAMQMLLPDDRKMHVFAAHVHGAALGSILIAWYGQRAEYLVGAVRDEGKHLNAGQLLLWRALLEMKRRGVRWFDLGGAHPEKTPKGIYHFKAGLRATPYQLAGEFDAARGAVAILIRTLVHFRS